MSIETWKSEFYDESPLDECSTLEVIERSLRKWRGLTSENLRKHSVFKDKSSPTISDPDGDFFTVTGATCSLCTVFFVENNYDLDSECVECPLFKVNNKTCYTGKDNPYRTFVYMDDPIPMIELLEVAYEREYQLGMSPANNKMTG